VALTTRTYADGVYNIWKTRETCAIEIYTPASDGLGNYNPVTKQYEPLPDTIEWSGPARVTAVRSGEREYLPGADMVGQTYQFQIKWDADILPTDAMRARVTDGGPQPDLEEYVYYIREAFNSGEDFEKTFYATVNSGR
jgi:hypothetical protein